MKIRDLEEPYKSLAIERAIFKYDLLDQNLKGSFIWSDTPEGYEFWDLVNEGEKPENNIISPNNDYLDYYNSLVKYFSENNINFT